MTGVVLAGICPGFLRVFSKNTSASPAALTFAVQRCKTRPACPTCAISRISRTFILCSDLGSRRFLIWQRKHISSPATRTRDLWRCAQKELTSGENPDLYFWIYSSRSSHRTRSVSWPGANVAVQDPRLFMQPQLLAAGTPSCSDTHRGKGIQGICPQREFPLSMC